MNLVVGATSFELQPLSQALVNRDNVAFLVTGAGGIETALNLCRYLADNPEVSRVVNVGIAGAYLDCGLNLLDLCVASHEVLADFGICHGIAVEPFSFPESPAIRFQFDEKMVDSCRRLLMENGGMCKTGTFLTVNSASATSERGNYLRDTHSAICENMEGFAVARVCESFGLPCLEIRCVSNFVEDRNLEKWRIEEACSRLGADVSQILDRLT